MGNCISSDVVTLRKVNASRRSGAEQASTASGVSSIMAGRDELRFANLRPSSNREVSSSTVSTTALLVSDSSPARNPLEQPLHNFESFRRTHRRRPIATIHQPEPQHRENQWMRSSSPPPDCFGDDHVAPLQSTAAAPQHESPVAAIAVPVGAREEEAFNNTDHHESNMMASSLDDSSAQGPPQQSNNFDTTTSTTDSWNDNMQPTVRAASVHRRSAGGVEASVSSQVSGGIIMQQQQQEEEIRSECSHVRRPHGSETSSVISHPLRTPLLQSELGSSNRSQKQGSTPSSLRTASQLSSLRLPPPATSFSRRTPVSDQPLFEFIT